MSLFIATPCYAGQVCLNHHASVIGLMAMLPEMGITDVSFGFTSGESLITRARDGLAAQFLDGLQEEMLFIDADVGFAPGDVKRLLGAPYPVAAGVYRLKGPRGQDGGFSADPARLGPIGLDGFASIRDAPAGFMRIKREVFFQLIALKSAKTYRVDNKVRYAFFDTMIDVYTGEYLGDDYAFCRRCEQAGVPVHIDVSADLSHQGQSLFTGRFNHARERP